MSKGQCGPRVWTIDRDLAEHVMRWERPGSGREKYPRFAPPYDESGVRVWRSYEKGTTWSPLNNIADAWEVRGALLKLGFIVTIFQSGVVVSVPDGSKFEVWNSDIPRALSLAALDAVRHVDASKPRKRRAFAARNVDNSAPSGTSHDAASA